jgi:hypothetical protein
MELAANTIVASKSGQFAIELKMHDLKAKRWVTVTYQKEGNAYLYLYGNTDDKEENIKKYLEEN